MTILKKICFLFLPAFIGVFIFGWGLLQYQDLKEPGLPVLLYHGIDSDGPKNKYTIDEEVFEEQLRWLKANGYKTLLPREIFEHALKNNPEKTVIISFDDGLMNNFNIVLPLLQEYGFKGIFFIVTDAINKKGFVSMEQLISIHNSGMEIGSHTVSHTFLDTINSNEISHELQDSKRIIENIIGHQVTSIAPPGGWYNSDAVVISKRLGYKFLFSCEIGLNNLTKKPFVYKRIEVLRGMQLNEFKKLLAPKKVFPYKIIQSIKFALHYIIGTDKYVQLSHITI